MGTGKRTGPPGAAAATASPGRGRLLHRPRESTLIRLPPDAHVHFIAVCGTAMGSLAGMLRRAGYRVSGSDDHVYPPMSEFLQSEGIEVQSGFDAARLCPPPDLVVVGNAVSRGNAEAEEVLDRRIPYASLPELVRDLFLRRQRSVVITGTHGKTTTTAMVAHLLTSSGRDPSYLIAGLPRNSPRPYHLGTGEHFVIEGDEYDSAFFAKHAKFLYYLPELLVINNIEFDHADIYRDLAEIERAFRQVINVVPRGGLVLANGDDATIDALLAGSVAPVQTFGLSASSHLRAHDILVNGQTQSFAVTRGAKPLGRFELKLSGAYNVRNALAALGVGLQLGLSNRELAEGLASFSGIRRRQELLGVVGGVTLIDDFAHHPTSVRHTLRGVREAYPAARLWAVFEPASATNARDIFEAQYSEALSAADRVVIGSVPRPERRGADPPFSPDRLVASLQAAGREAASMGTAEVAQYLVERVAEGDVVLFMSNAGFGGTQRKVLTSLQEQYGDA